MGQPATRAVTEVGEWDDDVVVDLVADIHFSNSVSLAQPAHTSSVESAAGTSPAASDSRSLSSAAEVTAAAMRDKKELLATTTHTKQRLDACQRTHCKVEMELECKSLDTLLKRMT